MEKQTFADASFDLVITSDVFEHVLDPSRGFSEIARTLRPSGVHAGRLAKANVLNLFALTNPFQALVVWFGPRLPRMSVPRFDSVG